MLLSHTIIILYVLLRVTYIQLINKSLHLPLYVLTCTMIKNFKSKETAKIFNRSFSKKLPSQIQKEAYKKLLMLDASSDLEDLKIPPSNRLEKLSGDRKGQFSIRINQKYRICFKYEENQAYDVEIVDYH